MSSSRSAIALAGVALAAALATVYWLRAHRAKMAESDADRFHVREVQIGLLGERIAQHPAPLPLVLALQEEVGLMQANLNLLRKHNCGTPFYELVGADCCAAEEAEASLSATLSTLADIILVIVGSGPDYRYEGTPMSAGDIYDVVRVGTEITSQLKLWGIKPEGWDHHLEHWGSTARQG